MTQTILTPEEHARLTRVRALAQLLDNSITVPGTSYRVGLDAIIGLVPGIGDVIGMLLSIYIVGEAVRMGASRMTVARMAVNVFVEGVVGIIPLVGDLFDAGWKANVRNVQLLDAAVTDGRRRKRVDTLFIVGLLVLLVATLIGLVVAAGAMLGLLRDVLVQIF